MVLLEIFNLPDVKAVEKQIIELVRKDMSCQSRHVDYKTAISELLKVRKRLLDSNFKMDDNYQSLLTGFNEALKIQLTKMREKTIAMFKAAKAVCDEKGIIEGMGKCYLGYEYSTIHPIQTDRAKKI